MGTGGDKWFSQRTECKYVTGNPTLDPTPSPSMSVPIVPSCNITLSADLYSFDIQWQAITHVNTSAIDRFDGYVYYFNDIRRSIAAPCCRLNSETSPGSKVFNLSVDNVSVSADWDSILTDVTSLKELLSATLCTMTTQIPTNNPTTSDPTSDPTTTTPTTSDPTTAAPTTDAPTPTNPTTTDPTTNPTTYTPTTADPTTTDPTTSVPTTAAPTTLNPTTAAPTTSVPTTSIPTSNPRTNIPSEAPTNCEENQTLENDDCLDNGCDENKPYFDFTLSFSVCKKQSFIGNKYGLWNSVVNGFCELGQTGKITYSNFMNRRRLKINNNTCDLNVVKYGMDILTQPVTTNCDSNGYRFHFGIEGCGDCVTLTQTLNRLNQMSQSEIVNAMSSCVNWFAKRADTIRFGDVVDLEYNIQEEMGSECDLTAVTRSRFYVLLSMIFSAVLFIFVM